MIDSIFVSVVSHVIVFFVGLQISNRTKFNKNKPRIVTTTVTKIKEKFGLFFFFPLIPSGTAIVITLFLNSGPGFALSIATWVIGVCMTLFVIFHYIIRIKDLVREKHNHIFLLEKIIYTIFLTIAFLILSLLIGAVYAVTIAFILGHTDNYSVYVALLQYVVMGGIFWGCIHLISPEKRINPDQLTVNYKENGSYFTLQADAQSINLNDDYIMVSLKDPDRVEIIPMNNIESIKAYYK